MNKKILSLSFIIAIILIIMVLLMKQFNFSINLLFFIFLLITVGIICLVIILKRINLLIMCIITFVVILFFGIRINANKRKEIKIIKEISQSIMSIGYIDEFPYHKKNSIYLTVNIIATKTKDRSDFFKIVPFKILLKIKNPTLNYYKGDLIRINKKISFPQQKIGSFNYKKYLLYHQIYGIIYTKETPISIINHKINRNKFLLILQKTIWKFRNSLLNKLKGNLSKNGYSFILSIFFGIRKELDHNIYKEFQNTGMTHLLAISGLHIGFIGMLFFNLFHLFLSKSKSYLFSIVALLMYILTIVPSGSSLRAFLMFALSGLFFIFGMKTEGISLLSISAIILLFINPYFIFDLGFQFSFLATFGILIFSKQIEERLPQIIPDKIKSLFSVTLAAFGSLFLLQWALFNKLALFSIVSSPFVVFLFGIFFSILFFCIIIFYIINFIFIAKIMNFLIFIFLKIISFLNIIPPIRLPKLPLYLGYILFIILVVITNFFFPFLKKILLKNKKTVLSVDIK